MSPPAMAPTSSSPAMAPLHDHLEDPSVRTSDNLNLLRSTSQCVVCDLILCEVIHAKPLYRSTPCHRQQWLQCRHYHQWLQCTTAPPPAPRAPRASPRWGGVTPGWYRPSQQNESTFNDITTQVALQWKLLHKSSPARSPPTAPDGGGIGQPCAVPEPLVHGGRRRLGGTAPSIRVTGQGVGGRGRRVGGRGKVVGGMGQRTRGPLHPDHVTLVRVIAQLFAVRVVGAIDQSRAVPEPPGHGRGAPGWYRPLPIPSIQSPKLCHRRDLTHMRH